MQNTGEPINEADFSTLYRRFLANELSGEQLDQFLEQLSLEVRQELVTALMTTTWQETQPVPMAPLYDTTWSLPGATRRWWGLAVAVVVMGLLAIGGWLLVERKGVKNGEPVATKQVQGPAPISPGGNKAVLVLADGSRIVLDSVRNGTVAQQGGMRIKKQSNGSLLYELAEQPAKLGEPIGYNTLSTPKGGQFTIVLPDGSQVWLNSVSSLTYPTAFTGNTREVVLTGEGYFEVAANARMPFIVKNTRMDVRVLGTAFNMMCYADEAAAKATLISGSVQAEKQDEQLLLQPGQQVVAAAAKKWKIVEQADIEEALAWKNGLFQLKKADVATIMRQIARWYDVEIVYTGEVPKKNLVGFLGRAEGLDKVLAVLAGSGIHCKVENRKLIVQ
jgi:ferric-dicitrate binding protein FerR (iron transport regulator)